MLRKSVHVAKDLICTAASELKADGLPRKMTRKESDDKLRYDVDDIFAIIDALHEAGLMCNHCQFSSSQLMWQESRS